VSSVEPQDHANEHDASQKSVRQFVEPARYCSVMLDLVEEALDEVALPVEFEIARALLLPIGLRRNDTGDCAGFKRRNQRVGIVALIGDDRIGRQALE
jgi:hypothetical protein